MRQLFNLSVLRYFVGLLVGIPIFTAIAPAAIAQLSSQPSAQSTTPLAVSPTTREEIAGQFVDLLVSGQFETARQYLHPVLASDWTADVLEERWTTFQNRTGTFIQRVESRSMGDLVFITTDFAETSDDLIFIFDDEQLITGIDFPLQPAELISE